MSYKSILVMRSIPELLKGPPDSPSLGVARHLRRDTSASSSSSSSSDTELTPFVRAKSLPPSPVTHSPLLHPRGFLRPSASLPEEAEAGPPTGPQLTVPQDKVPRQSIIRSLFYQQAGEGPTPSSRRHPARRSHLLKGGYFASTLPGLREPLLEHRMLEEAAGEDQAPSSETIGQSVCTEASEGHCPPSALSDQQRDTRPGEPAVGGTASALPPLTGCLVGCSQQQGSPQDSCGGLSQPGLGCDPPAVTPLLPGSVPPGSCPETHLAHSSHLLSRDLRGASSLSAASPQSGLAIGQEGTPLSTEPGSSLDEDLVQEEAVLCPPRPQEVTTRKFSMSSRGGYAGVAGYGTFAFGGDAGGMLGQGPLWARMAWAVSQSSEEQEEAGAPSLPETLPESSSDSPRACPELSSWEDCGQGPPVSLVQIRDLSGDSELADTLSLDISEVDPAYLNLSDLYDIKYLPLEFMFFRRVPKPAEQEPPSPDSEAESLGTPWSWPGPEDLEISEEAEDMQALLGEAISRKRKWSAPSHGLLHGLPGEPVEPGLRRRVRASVAHISRLLKGRLQGEAPPHGTCSEP